MLKVLSVFRRHGCSEDPISWLSDIATWWVYMLIARRLNVSQLNYDVASYVGVPVGVLSSVALDAQVVLQTHIYDHPDRVSAINKIVGYVSGDDPYDGTSSDNDDDESVEDDEDNASE